MTASESPGSVSEVREAAFRLLARREHSAKELVFKLVGKGWPEMIVEQVIVDLAESGLQSDRRFTDSLIRDRVSRHYGPRRILAELHDRGIDPALASNAIDEAHIDFFALATAFYKKKYGAPDRGLEYKERAKRAQSLYRRGFDSDHFRDLN
ncbi:MAG: regulatory protein RecX [Wenzhouxiangellaceae bacterium]|nr:regulatory protein RecX [Wenzhouxiangellaceae bacterium]